MRTLIRGGTVLPLGARTSNLVEADVLVEDGRIAEVGPGLRARDAEVVDASDTIVMPGFVDTHRHVWKTLLRNLAVLEPPAATPPVDAFGPHHTPDDVYAATLLGLLSAAQTGTTCVVDWSDIQLDDRYTEASLQAHADAGLRTVFVPVRPPWAEPTDASALRRLVERHATAGAPRLTVAAGSSGPGASDLAQVSTAWGVARELGLRIHAHAGVDPGDRGAVRELGEAGLLGPDVTLAHATSLDDADLEAVARHGVAIALAPAADMAAGRGAPPMQQLIDHGIRPGLAVDDELAGPGDLLTQMRAAQSIQHATLFDLKHAGKGAIPDLLGTRDVIRYATVDGARVAGLSEVTGSLERGLWADIVLLRTDRPNIAPVNDPVGAVVWGMDTSNVDWVFVGGRAVVRAGEPLADVARARALATAAWDRVASAAGRLIGTGGAA